MPMDELDREMMRAVAGYLARVTAMSEERAGDRTPLGDAISVHLGCDATTLPIVVEQVVAHRLVDADIALDELAGSAPGSLIGSTGGEQRFHTSMSELIANAHVRFAPGPVSYADRDTGPATRRRVVQFGVRLLEHDGVPLVVVQRGAAPQFGREDAQLEVMGADDDAVTAFLDRLRELMIARSVLRGQVLSFQATQFGASAGASFVVRPDVPEDAVVLERGVLEEVVQHVVGIGDHRDALRAAGQHLKRGVLLYGPPGTGKTLTIRHLLSRTPGVTAVVLTGSSIRYITQAAEIARTFAPSIVVLEDIDLVAMERHTSPQPLLFEVLDALDGLDSDADVAFVMTTNRVQTLERALATRPGRVDLAVEIPLPGPEARIRLFRRYAAGLPVGEDALDDAAREAEGTTGSFAKELMRRTVLRAAIAGRAPGDDDLAAALDALLASGAALTRRLLGGGGGDDAPDDPEAGGGDDGPDDPEAGGGDDGGHHVVTTGTMHHTGSYAPPMPGFPLSVVGEDPDAGGHGDAEEGDLRG
ncbi:AAA family ATPase [Clavibacter sp. MX14-G9D]|uniref:AAA family ATPase n=1 Tax=Clavibacter sp. MX14-G9D TaxID=3064656 RepID=UPI00293E3C3D|nr:AAA family ATPase [Clavibacter sp. MX14-G9D]